MNQWGWNQSSISGTWYQGTAATTNITLPSVSVGLAAPLSDREWLDAQVAEVCELASAA